MNGKEIEREGERERDNNATSRSPTEMEGSAYARLTFPHIATGSIRNSTYVFEWSSPINLKKIGWSNTVIKFGSFSHFTTAQTKI